MTSYREDQFRRAMQALRHIAEFWKEKPSGHYAAAALEDIDLKPSDESPADMDPPVIQAVYTRAGKALVCGRPGTYSNLSDDDERHHNCDAMGCSSIEHVLWRGPLTVDESPGETRAAAPYKEFVRGVYETLRIGGDVTSYLESMAPAMDSLTRGNPTTGGK